MERLSKLWQPWHLRQACHGMMHIIPAWKGRGYQSNLYPCARKQGQMFYLSHLQVKTLSRWILSGHLKHDATGIFFLWHRRLTLCNIIETLEMRKRWVGWQANDGIFSQKVWVWAWRGKGGSSTRSEWITATHHGHITRVLPTFRENEIHICKEGFYDIGQKCF